VFQPTHVNRNPGLLAEAIALARSHRVPIDVTAFDDTATDAIARCLADEGFPHERLTCSSDGAGCLPVYDADGQIVEMDVGRPAMLLGPLGDLLASGLPLERGLPVFCALVAEGTLWLELTLWPWLFVGRFPERTISTVPFSRSVKNSNV